MNKKPKAILYILLNIFISAATILLVMWLWDLSHPNPKDLEVEFLPMSTEPVTSLTAPAGSETEISTNPTGEFVTSNYEVEIVTIVGPGDLDVEYVEIKNNSPGPVDMTGWQLMDQDGHDFTFPTIILNYGGEIKILSQRGMDTVIELYWQSDVPIWESGETARLLDQNGDIITSYSIP